MRGESKYVTVHECHQHDLLCHIKISGILAFHISFPFLYPQKDVKKDLKNCSLRESKVSSSLPV